jgi:hypothetical protein
MRWSGQIFKLVSQMIWTPALWSVYDVFIRTIGPCRFSSVVLTHTK